MGLVNRVTGRFAFKVTPSKPSVAVTAHAGGTKALATSTGAAELISIAVCATAADSVLIGQPALPGKLLVISNDGVASAQVFGQGTDTINGVATATGVAQANGKTAVYSCAVLGNWARVLSA